MKFNCNNKEEIQKNIWDLFDVFLFGKIFSTLRQRFMILYMYPKPV